MKKIQNQGNEWFEKISQRHEKQHQDKALKNREINKKMERTTLGKCSRDANIKQPRVLATAEPTSHRHFMIVWQFQQSLGFKTWGIMGLPKSMTARAAFKKLKRLAIVRRRM